MIFSSTRVQNHKSFVYKQRMSCQLDKSNFSYVSQKDTRKYYSSFDTIRTIGIILGKYTYRFIYVSIDNE
jgi:hypothetical protein